MVYKLYKMSALTKNIKHIPWSHLWKIYGHAFLDMFIRVDQI